ncbi:MAG: contractile injection system protein, VgrG/Pvc8 family [Alphaproteobacteria bacterium]
MQPIYKITVDQENINSILANRLISINITDEFGLVSDSMTMELDNSDDIFEVPPRGVELEAFLGYDENNLYSMGKFIVDEIELSSPPNKITITARASNSTIKEDMGAIKAPKSKSWEECTLSTIVSTIAVDYGLTESIDISFKDIFIQHIDQTDESDLSFLERLAKEYGVEVKIAGGKIIFLEPARGTLPDGTTIPTTYISKADLNNYKMRISERGLYNQVIAKYYDLDDAEEKKVEVGDEKPAFSMRDVYSNETTALMQAKAKLADIERGQYSLSAETIGNPLLSAESKIEITGICEELQGAWILKQVSHSYSSSGYKTSFEATRPLT